MDDIALHRFAVVKFFPILLIMNTLVKTRFAPSPTGLMHLGNARTALFSALYAYHHGGIFLLRIEDTDRERSRPHLALQLMEDLKWLGLSWQEGPHTSGQHGPYYQSERSDIYNHYYKQLQPHVYPCFCSPQDLAISRKIQLSMGQAPRYAGTCAHLTAQEVQVKLEKGLKPTLRFRVPKGQTIQFIDLVKGPQRFLSDDLGDFIIRRAEGSPAFFFCNALDDALMGVTHVLRGEDHLTNTPRQILILQALQLPIPHYGHISLILGHDGSPLSKRNGSQSIWELKNHGWLAEGVINYLARLGHSYTQDHFLSLEELAKEFSTERLVRSPARFDDQQLHHWQQMAISHLGEDQLWEWMNVQALVPPHLKPSFITAVRPNITYPQDAWHWAKILFEEPLTLQPDASKMIQEAGPAFFQHALTALEESQADYQKLVHQLKKLTGTKGKALFMPIRSAWTGETHGPEMVHLLPLLGLEKARQRLQACLQS